MSTPVKRFYFKNGRSISPIVINTAFGHSGRGMFPYILFHIYYWLLLLEAKRKKVTIIAKSFTRFSWTGNYIPWNIFTWKFIQRLPGKGLLNAYGLTNKGVNKIARKIKKSIQKGYQVIPNYFPKFDKGIDIATNEATEAIKILHETLGSSFWIIELNFSCPNSKEKIAENMENAVELVRRLKGAFPELIIIAKGSPVHPYRFYRQLVEVGADCLHLINTFPHDLFYEGENKKSPLEKVGGGGVSGKPIGDKAYAYNKGADGFLEGLNIPVIYGGGVSSVEDCEKYFSSTKQCVGVAICTALIRLPREVLKIIKTYF